MRLLVVGAVFSITANGLQIGDRFVKRWLCAVGQTAANVLLGDRYFLCGGIYEY
jgi:hypothetical protein